MDRVAGDPRSRRPHHRHPRRRSSPTTSAAERIAELTGGDCSTSSSTRPATPPPWRRASTFAASGGTYVLVGVVKDRISFSDPEFHRKELTLYASRNATREDFDTVVARDARRQDPDRALNTHSCALEELPQVAAALAARPRRRGEGDGAAREAEAA